MIHNFNEGMIARQELFSCFDILHPESEFSDNKGFLKTLKNKDTFFSQKINKNHTYKVKKRYII